jgi:hypothetical protein
MSGIASKTAIVADVRKISVTPDLEINRGILKILDGGETYIDGDFVDLR